MSVTSVPQTDSIREIRTMLFSSWLRSLKSRWLLSSTRRPRPSRPWHGRPSVRLALERLEDRLTPTAGLLDPTFGAGAGYVLSSFSSSASANAVALQSDSRIVTAGGTGGDFLVGRYNADGSVDTSFGSGGYTTTAFNNTLGTHANAVAIQSDGKILAAGGATIDRHGTLTNYFDLARYNTNGTLDTTFGNNGEVMTAGTGDYASSMAVQTDGKIVVAGSYTSSPAALVRYNVNGTLDTTFANGGELVVTNLRIINGSVAVVIQPDGKIDLAGCTLNPSGNQGMFVVLRFNPDGSSDSSFGNGGVVMTNVGGKSDGFGGVALLSGGKILVEGNTVGQGNVPPGTLALVRYNADGTLDTTFGSSGNGIVTVPPPSGFTFGSDNSGVEIQSDGQIIATGSTSSTSSGASFAAVRLNADGSVDTSYGNAGWATVPLIGINDTMGASALQLDGRLLLAGAEKSTQNNGVVMLIRLTGDTTTAFSVTGFPPTVVAGTPETITVTALNPDGSTNTGYLGTVHFTSGDPHAVLPANYTLTAADQGVHTFNATLVTAGLQFLLVTDTTNGTLLGGEAGIQVTAAAATQFILSAPSSVKSGSAFSLTLTVEDAYGNVVTGYVGTVHFTSSDSTATLPADYTFTAADQGVHTFTSTAILRKRGTQTLSVTDTQNSTLTTTDNINVT